MIYLGTFSKIIAPALRMGWMVVPEALYPLVYNSKEATDMLSDRFTQRAVVRVSVTAGSTSGWSLRATSTARSRDLFWQRWSASCRPDRALDAP